MIWKNFFLPRLWPLKIEFKLAKYYFEVMRLESSIVGKFEKLTVRQDFELWSEVALLRATLIKE